MATPLSAHSAITTIAEIPGIGIIIAAGPTVPTDATAGFATGCTFHHTDGGAGSAYYVNEGTITSCNFDEVGTI